MTVTQYAVICSCGLVFRTQTEAVQHLIDNNARTVVDPNHQVRGYLTNADFIIDGAITKRIHGVDLDFRDRDGNVIDKDKFRSKSSN